MSRDTCESRRTQNRAKTVPKPCHRARQPTPVFHLETSMRTADWSSKIRELRAKTVPKPVAGGTARLGDEGKKEADGI